MKQYDMKANYIDKIKMHESLHFHFTVTYYYLKINVEAYSIYILFYFHSRKCIHTYTYIYYVQEKNVFSSYQWVATGPW